MNDQAGWKIREERERLRDLFAMNAIGRCAVWPDLYGKSAPDEYDERAAEGIARAAYLIADAMLLVRDGK